MYRKTPRLTKLSFREIGIIILIIKVIDVTKTRTGIVITLGIRWIKEFIFVCVGEILSIVLMC